MSLRPSALVKATRHVARSGPRASLTCRKIHVRSISTFPQYNNARISPIAFPSPRYQRFSTISSLSGGEPSSSRFEDAGHASTHEVIFSLTACPGCGALAQIVDLGAAGFYTAKRKAVLSHLKRSGIQDEGLLEESLASRADHPLCDRCHDLIHHQVGVPIIHPSIDSLADIISETPHKYNHIYHVIDAADFPMSLIPGLHRALSASNQRSKNRRSKNFKFMHGKLTEITFVITRSDLLAPKKEQVDRLMPNLVETLRDVLGSTAKDVRLGNVVCVSAKRGWWIKDLKADVWQRGGAGWMVGKVNVGKSNLFEAVFPKGKGDDMNFDAVRRKAYIPSEAQERLDQAEEAQALKDLRRTERQQDMDEDSLLPPARLETPYPIMPTISSLPGTTAAPIRIPFGKGRGELIDLPGLARSELDKFVVDAGKETILMKSRCTPEQFVIKPGSSLLLGGLIRITPLDPDIVILAYPFLNLSPHLTSNEKAAGIQSGEISSGLGGLIANSDAQASMASVGTFDLKWDMTKHRAGPLTSASAVGLKPKNLPFMVLSADILVEGVGWVELVAQVRKKKTKISVDDAADTSIRDRMTGSPKSTTFRDRRPRPPAQEQPDEPILYPAVEVFSPQGRFVSARRPMNAWVLGGLHSRPGMTGQKGRPRRSMKSARGSGPRNSDATTAKD